jgi:hypothetical protein
LPTKNCEQGFEDELPKKKKSLELIVSFEREEFYDLYNTPVIAGTVTFGRFS